MPYRIHLFPYPSGCSPCTLNELVAQVTRASLPELVHKLINQVRGSANVYRDDAIAVVLASCRADGFAHVPSFKWLITTLLSVAALHSKHGPDVASLLLEVRSPHRHASPRIATHRHASPLIATHRILRLVLRRVFLSLSRALALARSRCACLPFALSPPNVVCSG